MLEQWYMCGQAELLRLSMLGTILRNTMPIRYLFEGRIFRSFCADELIAQKNYSPFNKFNLYILLIEIFETLSIHRPLSLYRE